MEDYRLTDYWSDRFRGRLDSKKLIFLCLSRRPCLLEKLARRLEIRLIFFFFVYESSLQLSKCFLMIYNFMNMRNILVLLETKAGESMSRL